MIDSRTILAIIFVCIIYEAHKTHGRMSLNDEYGKTYKKVTVAFFKVLSL